MIWGRSRGIADCGVAAGTRNLKLYVIFGTWRRHGSLSPHCSTCIYSGYATMMSLRLEFPTSIQQRYRCFHHATLHPNHCTCCCYYLHNGTKRTRTTSDDPNLPHGSAPGRKILARFYSNRARTYRHPYRWRHFQGPKNKW